jgi:NADH-ubiquinone oxidoreductase chain 2
MEVSIELQSFGLYILSTLYGDSELSTSAGLKYFLLGGLSSCLILLGAGLILCKKFFKKKISHNLMSCED